MDDMVLQHLDDGDRMTASEIAALFAQLDQTDAVAPIEAGLEQLCNAVEELRRREGRFKR